MRYVRSFTLTDIFCPKCGRAGRLVLKVFKHSETFKALYVRHYVRHSEGRRVYYHHLMDVDVDDSREDMLYNDEIKCILMVAVATNARKLELGDKIVIHYNTFTITLDSTLKIEYVVDSAIELSKDVVLAVSDMITKCYARGG